MKKPWLTNSEAKAITFPNTVHGVKLREGAKNAFVIIQMLDKAEAVKWKEDLLEHKYYNSTEFMENNRGGWIPSGLYEINEATLTAKDLAFRQKMKDHNNFEEADLIRRVVSGGSVEIHDYKNGTLFVYGKGWYW